MTPEPFVVAGSCGLFLAVPAASWWVLRRKRGALPGAAAASVAYLLIGNALSRVLLIDLIYPRDIAASGLAFAELQERLALHTIVSMGGAAVVVLGLVAWGRRYLAPLGTQDQP